MRSVAVPAVGDDRAAGLATASPSTIEGKRVIPAGRGFYKMSGSGNDFVMIDARTEPRGRLDQPEVVQAICARGTGVGADGIVFLERSEQADVRLTYLNADGSRADFCGNATLCTTRLATELGMGSPSGLRIETDSGIVSARNRDINSGPYDSYIQTDAAINRGNSGGPLFNLNGKL